MGVCNVCTVALMRHGGSHLIRPIVSRMGYEIVEPGNFGAPLDKSQGPVIIFLRDPRDRMVSTLRWWLNKPRKAGLLPQTDRMDIQLVWLLTEGGFLAEMLQWARIWCRKEDALRVRFEEMCKPHRGVYEVDKIAHFLKFDCDPFKIFAETFEKGRTFTGQYSDWKKVFNASTLDVWCDNGGLELLELMGYE